MKPWETIQKGAKSFYDQLVKEVAAAIEDYMPFDAAMEQAANNFYETHHIEVESVLKLAGKTREDWKRDAILKSREMALKRT